MDSETQWRGTGCRMSPANDLHRHRVHHDAFDINAARHWHRAFVSLTVAISGGHPILLLRYTVTLRSYS